MPKIMGHSQGGTEVVPQLLGARTLALDFQHCCVQQIPGTLVALTTCNLMDIKRKDLTKEASILHFVFAINIALSLHRFIPWHLTRSWEGQETVLGGREEQPFFMGLLTLHPVISQWTQSQLWKHLLLISHVLYMSPVDFDQLCHSTFQNPFLPCAEVHY